MDSAMPTRKYGYKNIYTCPKCGGQTVTIDVDEGVTPFMLRCRATGKRAIAMAWRSPACTAYQPTRRNLNGNGSNHAARNIGSSVGRCVTT